jgi:hypothetical protein
MWSGLTTFFSNWTARHWLNFLIFMLGGLVTSLSITSSTAWAEIPRLFTPFTTIGFALTILGFLLQTATGEPRDPKRGTRASDPLPTVAVDTSKKGEVDLVPPVTPGRPVDPDTKEP